LLASVALALIGASLPAKADGKVGMLSCDVSAGIGLVIFQKQSMTCAFRPDAGGPPDYYVGQIDEFGVAFGVVEKGHLIWGVIAASSGLPHGALAGSYAGVGAEATAVAGLGANVLVGGTGRSFSLQPLSVEGQVGVNIAAGVTSVTLRSAP